MASLVFSLTVGMIALPEMRKYGYEDRLSTGSLAAGGTLGILIPPSIGFVIYSMLTEVSLGKLFMAGWFPGILLAMLFIATIYIQCRLNPGLGPSGPRASLMERLKAIRNTWAVVILAGIITGGIYTGVFTPTEAAAIAAFTAFIIGVARRRLTLKDIYSSFVDATITVCMVMTIMFFIISPLFIL